MKQKAGIVAQDFIPSTWEAKGDGSLQFDDNWSYINPETNKLANNKIS